jgi:hypothetical protein
MNSVVSQKDGKSNAFPLEMIFYRKTATAILGIDRNLIDTETKKDVAETLGLLKKEEFHITLIGSKTGDDILLSLHDLPDVEKSNMLDKIYSICASFDWKATLKNEFFFLEKDYASSSPIDPQSTISETRKSIIQMVEIDKMKDFYTALNTLVSKQYKEPLPHITLYTVSTREDKKLRGIGVYSRDHFEHMHPQKI